VPTSSPSTDNGRTIAAMYQAFGRGDVEHVLGQIDPDVEWIETEAENLPINGRSSSPQEVLQNVFAKVRSISRRSSSTPSCRSRRGTMWS
jgi:ketosteroid isomerase-like protein